MVRSENILSSTITIYLPNLSGLGHMACVAMFLVPMVQTLMVDVLRLSHMQIEFHPLHLSCVAA
jgi:hypothetical protein